MRIRRADDNQKEVVDALRKIGAVVTPIHRLGQGISDLLVSFRQQWWVFEVKNLKGRGNKLTPDEKEWVGKQRAPVYIVTSPQEAVNIVTQFAP